LWYKKLIVPSNAEFLPRHVVQRRQYDLRRYARHLSDAELNQRSHDIFLNLLRVNHDAKIGVKPITPANEIWLEKWTHVLEEMQLRYGPYPAGFTRDILNPETIPDFASDLARKAAFALSSTGLKQGDVFIKFGKREYMERLHLEGSLRIQAASYFSKTEHNGAVRDDELALNLCIFLSRNQIVNLVRNPEEVPPNVPDHRLEVGIRALGDYWLYCLTNSVEPRLFVDFNADSCVIIRDRNRFARMLREATRSRIPTAMRDCSAAYVDPLLPTTANIDVPFAKHFRYAYQDEYRFCWLPSPPVDQLRPLDVQLGSLRDFSNLIVL